MKIRSITAFLDPGWPLNINDLDHIARLIEEAKRAYEAEGYEVQTTRLATTPFPRLLREHQETEALKLATEAEAAATQRGFDYLSLGPALPELPGSYNLVLPMLAATQNVVFGAKLTTQDTAILPSAVMDSAKIIKGAAELEANGFANLRFAALANVPPGAPFFPSAYHSGKKPAFAIGTQAADLAVEAFTGAKNVAEGAQKLTYSIEQHARRLAKLGEKLSSKWNVSFGGIDFSLAPFPEESESLGAAFEAMGVPRLGLHGSLAAAAILTSAIESADFPRAGFNGLMLPPLEDAILAKRVAEGQLSVSDLLAYSAVCGTGVDTVPLPGNTPTEQLAALLMDVAALALRLNKPLTARLMPIPGKKVGEETSFDFEFFANSRVMPLRAEGLHGTLAASEPIPLKSRNQR